MFTLFFPQSSSTSVVKVYGKLPKEQPIVALASTQGAVTAVASDSAIYGWSEKTGNFRGQAWWNGSTQAGRREDGMWTARGRNSSRIVDHINGLGPVTELAFFSEPGSQECGYVIWIEREG